MCPFTKENLNISKEKSTKIKKKTKKGAAYHEGIRRTDSKRRDCAEGNVLKVDSFINHQMDIDLFERWHRSGSACLQTVLSTRF